MDFVHQRCPNGENSLDLTARATEVWKEIVQAHAPNVLVITHVSVIRALLSHLLECPLKNVMNIAIDDGSVTKIRLLEYSAMIDYVNG